MTLTEFLLARIDEGEHTARVDRKPMAVDGWEWYADNFVAECEGKRQIVELMRNTIALYGLRVSPNGRGEDADRVLRYLAQPYASHPDFDPAWQVSP